MRRISQILLAVWLMGFAANPANATVIDQAVTVTLEGLYLALPSGAISDGHGPVTFALSVRYDTNSFIYPVQLDDPTAFATLLSVSGLNEPLQAVGPDALQIAYNGPGVDAFVIGPSLIAEYAPFVPLPSFVSSPIANPADSAFAVRISITPNPGNYSYGGDSGTVWDGGKTYMVSNVLVNVFSASPVPEPGTWTLAVIAFGVIGATMRQHRRQNVAIALA